MSQEHYKAGRVSALSGSTNYKLVEQLRSIRESGDAEMFAVEEYDPNFSLKLAEATDPAAANALLVEWLRHRTEVLQRTQGKLRDAWRTSAHATPQAQR